MRADSERLRLKSSWIVAILFLWIGLNPVLRLCVYPSLTLPVFILGLEPISLLIIALEIFSLRALNLLSGFPWQEPLAWVRGFLLLPIFWLLIAAILWFLLEFDLLQEAKAGSLYDGQLFAMRQPWSFTSLSFLLSAWLEEVFFRAFLPDFLQSSLQKSGAILLSALLFSLAHIGLHTSAFSLLSYFLVALCLSYAREFHGLGAAIALHFLNNALVFGNSLFQSSWLDLMRNHSSVLYPILAMLAAGFMLVARDLKRLLDRDR